MLLSMIEISSFLLSSFNVSRSFVFSFIFFPIQIESVSSWAFHLPILSFLLFPQVPWLFLLVLACRQKSTFLSYPLAFYLHYHFQEALRQLCQNISQYRLWRFQHTDLLV